MNGRVVLVLEDTYFNMNELSKGPERSDNDNSVTGQADIIVIVTVILYNLTQYQKLFVY
jgi:hypothetical protein